HVVHDTVLGAVRHALKGTTGLAEPARDDVATALRTYALRAPSPAVRTLVEPVVRDGAPLAVADRVREAAADVPPFAPASRASFPSLRFVGQVLRGFLVCEGGERVVLIDQHAAHERVAFERLRAEHRDGAVERQALLLPATVDLTPDQTEALH